MKKYVYTLVLIPAFFLSCKSVDENAFVEFSEAPLFGMIYDSESLPVVGAELMLDDKKTALTDINGRVLFSGVSRGEHLIVIDKEGFEEARMVLNFSNRDQVLYSTLISLHNILDNLEDSLQIGKIADAGLFRERASGINSDDLRFRYLNVVYLAESREYEEASTEIGLLRKTYPDNPYIVMTQAKILFYGLNKKIEALEVLEEFPQADRNKDLESIMEKINYEINAEKMVEEEEGENDD